MGNIEKTSQIETPQYKPEDLDRLRQLSPDELKKQFDIKTLENTVKTWLTDSNQDPKKIKNITDAYYNIWKKLWLTRPEFKSISQLSNWYTFSQSTNTPRQTSSNSYQIPSQEKAPTWTKPLEFSFWIDNLPPSNRNFPIEQRKLSNSEKLNNISWKNNPLQMAEKYGKSESKEQTLDRQWQIEQSAKKYAEQYWVDYRALLAICTIETSMWTAWKWRKWKDVILWYWAYAPKIYWWIENQMEYWARRIAEALASKWWKINSKNDIHYLEYWWDKWKAYKWCHWNEKAWINEVRDSYQQICQNTPSLEKKDNPKKIALQKIF